MSAAQCGDRDGHSDAAFEGADAIAPRAVRVRADAPRAGSARAKL